jgi:hypothetical protein
MTTYEPQPDGGDDGLFPISSVVASPASPSASPGKGSRKMTRGGSGPPSRTSFASYDPAGSSWKTFQACLDGEWETYSQTWPASGMTRNGTAYRQPTSVPPIYASASGLWPTPETGLSPNGHGRRGGSPGYGHQSGVSLETMARLWPTPTASLADAAPAAWKDDGRPWWKQSRASRNLAAIAEGLTPYQAETGGHLNPAWVEWLMGYPAGWTDCED